MTHGAQKGVGLRMIDTRLDGTQGVVCVPAKEVGEADLGRGRRGAQEGVGLRKIGTRLGGTLSVSHRHGSGPLD